MGERGGAERRHTRIDDTTISYLVAGDGPPLVLIHGLAGSGAWWSSNVEALSEHLRVYALDLVAFGASRTPDPFVLDTAADYVYRWMEREGIGRAHVVGHSLGGYVAAQLAADHPGVVDRLILVSAAIAPFRPRVLRHLARVAREASSRRLLPRILADSRRAGPRTLWRASRQLRRGNLAERLETLEAETLLIWGDDDALVPIEVGRHLLTVLPRARLHVMRGAGHIPAWHDPEAFNRLVLTFVTSGFAGIDEQDRESPSHAAAPDRLGIEEERP